MEMQSLKKDKKVRRYLRKAQFISHFISKLTMTYDPLFGLLRNREKFTEDSEYQTTFDKIKVDLQNPRVLLPPKLDKSLLLYLSVSETSIGCMIIEEGEEEHSNKVIYCNTRKIYIIFIC